MDLGGAPPRALKDGSSLGMVAPACNLRTWEAESGLGTQNNKYEASLGYIARPSEKDPRVRSGLFDRPLPLWDQS